MTTLVQPMSGARTGLVLAWSFTVLAILAIGLVVVAAPMPQLSAASAGAAGPVAAQPPVQLPGQLGDAQTATPGGLDA